MTRWFKSGIFFKTTALWLISSLLILYKAELTIADSPDSASTFPVNFSIPWICTRGSEMRDPSQSLILKFKKISPDDVTKVASLAKAGSLHEDEGCTNLSVVMNCHISGNVSQPGTYRLYSSNEGEEFKKCNRSYNVPDFMSNYSVDESTTQFISIETSMNTSPKSTTIKKLMTTRPLTTTVEVFTNRSRVSTTPPTKTTTRSTATVEQRTTTGRVFTNMSRVSTTLPTKTTTRSTTTVEQRTTTQTSGTSYLTTGTSEQSTLSILLSTMKTRLTTTLQLPTTMLTPTAAIRLQDPERKSYPWKIPLICVIVFVLLCGVIAIIASKRYRRKRRGNKQITAVDRDEGDTHDHQSEYTGRLDSDSGHIYFEIQQIQHENVHVEEEFEMQELNKSDDYEHLQHSSKHTANNPYDTVRENTSFTPAGKMKRSISSGDRSESGYIDMTFCSRDTHNDYQNCPKFYPRY